jgi:FlaA1/EpsC-like NDP-sugar epimerase
VLGDVRDISLLRYAFKGADIVIHAAAVKYLDWAEMQPRDCVKTNIIGSMNVIDACIESDVDICVGCSTDKAPYARNVYGCSKQIMEALFKDANKYGSTAFTIVRYGNVIGSTGSIIPKWKEAVKAGKNLKVTGRNMVRFMMTVEQAAKCVIKSIEKRKNVIPIDLKTVNMWDLAGYIANGKVGIEEIPIRPGERDYEILVADYEGKEFSTKNALKYTKEDILKII